MAIVAAPFTAVGLMLASDRQWLLSLAAFVVSALVWRFDSLRLVPPRTDGVADARQ